MEGFRFLSNVNQGKNSWWRYLITVILTSMGNFIGSLIMLTTIILFIIIQAPTGLATSNAIESELSSVLNDPVFFMLILLGSSILTLLSFWIGIRFIHQKTLKILINAYEKIRWKHILKGIILWGVILSLMTLIGFLIDPTSYKFTFNLNTFIFMSILSLVTLPLAATFEEMFFRGYLLQAFSLITKRPLALILITSLLFGAIHLFNVTDPMQSIYYITITSIFGFMLSAITLGEGGIETAIGIHTINNLFLTLICNNNACNTIGFNNIPSIFTYTTNYTLTTYIISIILFTTLTIITLLIIFKNQPNTLKKILSIKTKNKTNYIT